MSVRSQPVAAVGEPAGGIEGAKDGPVRKREGRHQRAQFLERNSAQEREALVAPRGSTRERPLPARGSCKEAAHARGDTALVQ